MEEMENNDRQKDEIYSKSVRAGKRTYFFDVKSTKSDDYYLTLTESKKRFNSDDGTFSFEKHKIFLYREDFENFIEGLKNVMDFVNSNKKDDAPTTNNNTSDSDNPKSGNETSQ